MVPVQVGRVMFHTHRSGVLNENGEVIVGSLLNVGMKSDVMSLFYRILIFNGGIGQTTPNSTRSVYLGEGAGGGGECAWIFSRPKP